MPTNPRNTETPDHSKATRHAGGVGFAETRWQDRPLLSLQLASEISAISVASLYRAANDERLVLLTLYGRTLVDTVSLIGLMNSAEPWTPSDRGKEARAKRSNAKQSK